MPTILLVGLLSGLASAEEPVRWVAPPTTAVAIFPDAEPRRPPVATFPDVEPPRPAAPPDPSVELLATNPYEEQLIQRQIAQNLYGDDASLENPYTDELRFANPYAEELRLANPYPEELRLANPYGALPRR